MPTVCSVQVGAEATDVGAGLPSGCYLGQVRPTDFAAYTLVAYGPAPPPDPADWFWLGARDTFTFRAGPGAEPCWVRVDSPTSAGVVARRRVV